MTKVDLKVVLLGHQNVGKSCVVDRFLNSKFDSAQKNTIGAAFGAKRVFLPSGQGMTLGIWDTAGAERFESLSRVYYHSAGVALICFDPSNFDSWLKLEFWVSELHENEPQCRIYLIETKYDQIESGGERAVSEARQLPIAKAAVSRHVQVLWECVGPEADVKSYAADIDATVVRTSAKTGLNVAELFVGVARDHHDVMHRAERQVAGNTIHIQPAVARSKKELPTLVVHDRV
eukprot:CAMPEP_0198231544 /NCGR_PEP_ID=MMETSP1445-20131203/115259_1 /TAXON_ID=36898 /ORGANISM="Pyramimonas sp., Strain CCMP2087" /LENGTH=232 /DNA_ID=CAMNT_0043912167 /DNA_START=636 /DNA_END=1335 /DNA_ORIENTATION=+